jgi:hypothetical protein
MPLWDTVDTKLYKDYEVQIFYPIEFLSRYLDLFTIM